VKLRLVIEFHSAEETLQSYAALRKVVKDLGKGIAKFVGYLAPGYVTMYTELETPTPGRWRREEKPQFRIL
jgi:hypothetical protein